MQQRTKINRNHSEKLPAISGLCHEACAFKTCSKDVVGVCKAWRQKTRIAKCSQWPRRPQAGSQPSHCRKGKSLLLSLLRWPQKTAIARLNGRGNRTDQNRQGEPRPTHFVYMFVSTVKFPVSTFVGALIADDTENFDFHGHSRAHFREHSRAHFPEHSHGSNRGSNFAVACSVLLHLIWGYPQKSQEGPRPRLQLLRHTQCRTLSWDFFLFFHGCFREGRPAKQAPPELFGGFYCFFTEHILLTSWGHILRA